MPSEQLKHTGFHHSITALNTTLSQHVSHLLLPFSLLAILGLEKLDCNSCLHNFKQFFSHKISTAFRRFDCPGGCHNFLENLRRLFCFPRSFTTRSLTFSNRWREIVQRRWWATTGRNHWSRAGRWSRRPHLVAWRCIGRYMSESSLRRMRSWI